MKILSMIIQYTALFNVVGIVWKLVMLNDLFKHVCEQASELNQKDLEKLELVHKEI